MSKSISILSALGCTFIWGTTFIAQDTGMEFIGPYLFNGVRFFVGFLVLLPFFLYFEKKNVKKELVKDRNEFFNYSLLIGVFLFLGSALQQISLQFTDVANAAFFTIFYVPMVPIIVFFLFKEKIFALYTFPVAKIINSIALSVSNVYTLFMLKRRICK